MTGPRRLIRKLFPTRAARALVDEGSITRDHVVWAYRVLLDREPESEAAIQEKLDAWGTTRELRTDIMISQEFRLKNPDLTYSPEPHVLIKEIDDRLRLFVDLSDVAIGLNIIRGRYERSETKFVRSMVKPGQTVLDIGAHIGFHTIAMASLVGPSGKVYAFEPFDQVVDLLRRSISENRFEDRVIVEQAAVGEVSSRANLVFIRSGPNSGVSYRFREGMKVPNWHEVSEVRLIALDDYPIRRPVSFVKIDVEGSEPLALRGASRMLREDRPVILSELLPAQLERVAKCTPAHFIAEMRASGYECRVLEEGRVGRTITGVDSLTSAVFLPIT